VDPVVALVPGGALLPPLLPSEQDFLTIQVTDLAGWKQVKNGLTAALDGTEFPFGTLLSLCAVTHVDPFSFTQDR